MATTTNATYPTDYENYYDYDYDFIRMTPEFQIPSGIFIAILICIAIIGNVLSITAYVTDARLCTVYDFYIFNLAVTDFLIGCISMPFYAVYTLQEFHWTLGPVFCKVWLLIDFTLCLESVLLILLLSLDRLLLISYGPFYTSKVTKRKAVVQIAVSWLIAFVLYGPSIIGWNLWFGNTSVPNDDCDVEFAHNAGFTTATGIVEFVIPVVSLMVLNSCIYYKIRARIKINVNLAAVTNIKRNDISVMKTGTNEVKTTENDNLTPKHHSKITFDPQSINQTNPSHTGKNHQSGSQVHTQNSRTRRDLKAARFLAMLVIVFMICWAPYTVTTMFVSFCGDECVNTSVYEAMNWLLWSKSAINPFLYAYNSSRYRYNFKKFLICCKKQVLPSNGETTLHTQ